MAFLVPAFMGIGAAALGAGASLAGAAATAAPYAGYVGTALSISAAANKPKVPGQQPLPTQPSPTDTLAQAQTDAVNRMRMIAATGGQTAFAGMGAATIDPTAIQKRTLLG